MTAAKLQSIADEVQATAGTGRQISPFTSRPGGLELADAYRVLPLIRKAREAKGQRAVGRKIGFTNRTIWQHYGVFAPIWGYVYDIACRDLSPGATLSLASGVALVAATLAGPPHWLGVLAPAFFFFFSHGINFPCGQAGSVAPFPRHAGAASGLYGFFVMVVATLTGAWIGATHDGTVYPLAFTMAAFACIAFATTFGRIARRAPATAVPAAMDSNL